MGLKSYEDGLVVCDHRGQRRLLLVQPSEIRWVPCELMGLYSPGHTRECPGWVASWRSPSAQWVAVARTADDPTSLGNPSTRIPGHSLCSRWSFVLRQKPPPVEKYGRSGPVSC